jgi:hypothetical protein
VGTRDMLDEAAVCIARMVIIGEMEGKSIWTKDGRRMTKGPEWRTSWRLVSTACLLVLVGRSVWSAVIFRIVFCA